MMLNLTLPFRRFCKGFTIIELLVVMAILGILSAAVLPLGEMLLASQKERELRQALWEIRAAIDEYKKVTTPIESNVQNLESGYPPSLNILVEGIPDPRPEAAGKRVYFLRAIPRDPFADSKLPAESTWRLRSYASTAENPSAGADVYDIHSSSDAKAMDDSYYAKW
jgi:general secretion pathway protein G